MQARLRCAHLAPAKRRIRLDPPCKLDYAALHLALAKRQIQIYSNTLMQASLHSLFEYIYAWLNSIKNQKNRKKSIDYLRKRLYYILIGL